MIIIKTFVPEYFDKFRCIADKCPDTCCAGWEADLDGEIIEKYKTIDGELGEKIQNSLAKDETDCDIFALCENGRCPFLNSCNLCDIQAAHGEEFLSKTCSLFPRFFEDFGEMREMGLGFGCPEAARIMLTDSEPFSLCLYEEFPDENRDIDKAFLAELIALRSEIFTVLDDKKLSFRKKIENVTDLATSFQRDLDIECFCDGVTTIRSFGECISILEKMEYIRPERRDFVSSLKCKKLSNDSIEIYQSDFEKLMKYYIFRYFLAYGYDYDVITPIKLGIFACIVISRIYSYLGNPDFEARVKVMYSYSKEVEYSDVNMDLLDEAMYMHCSADDLIKIL